MSVSFRYHFGIVSVRFRAFRLISLRFVIISFRFGWCSTFLSSSNFQIVTYKGVEQDVLKVERERGEKEERKRREREREGEREREIAIAVLFRAREDPDSIESGARSARNAHFVRYLLPTRIRELTREHLPISCAG